MIFCSIAVIIIVSAPTTDRLSTCCLHERSVTCERCCPVSQTQVTYDSHACTAWRLSRLASPIFHRAEIRRGSGAAAASSPRRKDPTSPSLHRAHKQTSTDTVVMRDARRRRDPFALPPVQRTRPTRTPRTRTPHAPHHQTSPSRSGDAQAAPQQRWPCARARG